MPKLVGIETQSARGQQCLKAVRQLLPPERELMQAFDKALSDEYFSWAGSRELFESIAPAEASPSPESAEASAEVP